MTVLGRVAAALLSTLLTLLRSIDQSPSSISPTSRRAAGGTMCGVPSAEFSVDVRLNALGFREPRLSSPKPPGVLRAVAPMRADARCPEVLFLRSSPKGVDVVGERSNASPSSRVIVASIP